MGGMCPMGAMAGGIGGPWRVVLMGCNTWAWAVAGSNPMGCNPMGMGCGMGCNPMGCNPMGMGCGMGGATRAAGWEEQMGACGGAGGGAGVAG